MLGGILEGIWERIPQPPEAIGSLGAKRPAAGGKEVWGRKHRPRAIFAMFQ